MFLSSTITVSDDDTPAAPARGYDTNFDIIIFNSVPMSSYLITRSAVLPGEMEMIRSSINILNQLSSKFEFVKMNRFLLINEKVRIIV